MRRFEDVLTECIDDVKAGRVSMEECLNRYQSMRERLEPLLKIALAVQEPPAVSPSPDFKLRARMQLMEHIHEKQGLDRWPWSRHRKVATLRPVKTRFSLARVGVVVGLALLALVGGTVYAAQDSLPGDILYPIKLVTEQVRIVLRADDVGRAERALSFADRRVTEIEELAEQGRAQDVGAAVEKYDNALDMTVARIESGRGKGLATRSITAQLAETTAEHLSVLDAVYQTAPEEAKPAIAAAIERARMAHEWATERLGQIGS
jgi:hypothetical protein